MISKYSHAYYFYVFLPQSSNTTMKIDQKQSNSTDSDGQKHETVGDSMAMFGNRKTNDKIQSNVRTFNFFLF